MGRGRPSLSRHGGETQQISVRIPAALLRIVETYAERQGTSRADAARSLIQSAVQARSAGYRQELVRRGPWAHGGDPDSAAVDWWLADLSIEQAREWLDAGVVDADVAAELVAHGLEVAHLEGVDPLDVKPSLPEGVATLAGYLSSGDITVEQLLAHLADT